MFQSSVNFMLHDSIAGLLFTKQVARSVARPSFAHGPFQQRHRFPLQCRAHSMSQVALLQISSPVLQVLSSAPGVSHSVGESVRPQFRPTRPIQWLLRPMNHAAMPSPCTHFHDRLLRRSEVTSEARIMLQGTLLCFVSVGICLPPFIDRGLEIVNNGLTLVKQKTSFY